MTGHSEELNELATALARAQASLRSAASDAVGHVGSAANGRSYRYATLSSVWDAARKALTRNGLSVVQTCQPADRGLLRLTTTLLHVSGQWLSGTEEITLPVQTAQGYGSALTYARRYGLAAIVGVCVDDDDDDAAAACSTAPASAAAASPGANGHRPAEASHPAGGSDTAAGPGGQEIWRSVAYNRAAEAQLREFARAYALAKGAESITSDDLRRDFHAPGKLVDFFGALPLGRIVDSVRNGESLAEARQNAAGSASSRAGRS